MLVCSRRNTCVALFDLLEPTPKVYRVPRVSQGSPHPNSAGCFRLGLLPQTPGPPLPDVMLIAGTEYFYPKLKTKTFANVKFSKLYRERKVFSAKDLIDSY